MYNGRKGALMRFGEKLSELIKRGQLTEMELAQRSGVSQTAISKYARGLRLPTFVNAVLLARALRVPLEVFAECDDIAGPDEGPKPRRRVGD